MVIHIHELRPVIMTQNSCSITILVISAVDRDTAAKSPRMYSAYVHCRGLHCSQFRSPLVYLRPLPQNGTQLVRKAVELRNLASCNGVKQP